jgi:hypothetical protein
VQSRTSLIRQGPPQPPLWVALGAGGRHHTTASQPVDSRLSPGLRPCLMAGLLGDAAVSLERAGALSRRLHSENVKERYTVHTSARRR